MKAKSDPPDLFRAEVFAAEEERHRVLSIRLPMFVPLTLGLTLVIILAVGIALGFMRVPQTLDVQAKVVSSEGTPSVVAPYDLYVTSVSIEVGDLVEAGDGIAVVEAVAAQVIGFEGEGAADTFQVYEQEIEKRRKSIIAHFRLESERNQSLRTTAVQRVRHAAASINLLTKRLEIIEDRVTRYSAEAVASAIPRNQIDLLRETAIDLRLQKSAALVAQAEAKALLREYDIQAEQLKIDEAAELSKLTQELAELRRAKSERAGVLTAQVAGEVIQILARPGERIAANRPVAIIRPHDATVVVEMEVPASYVPLLKVGTECSVRLTWLQAGDQRFDGTIAYIPRTIHDQAWYSEFRTEQKAERAEPSITIQAKIDFSELETLEALQPGLPIPGMIIVKEDTIYRSLFSL